MLMALAVNGFGLAGCLYAYSRRWEWDRGPRLLLRAGTIMLSVSMAMTLAALALEAPAARAVMAVAVVGIAAVVAWRKRTAARRGRLTSETAAPAAAEVPPHPERPVRPIRSTAGGWSSVTIRDIENMEVQQ